MIKDATKSRIARATEVFRRLGGVLRTCEALDAGIHRRTLYAMRDAGLLERLDRGLYRLAGLPPLSSPDLVAVARKVPTGVICLISALHFHGITTQIPHAVSIALKRGSQAPRLEFPPTRIYWFSGDAFTSGIEKAIVDGTSIQFYSAEKTLADCFKFRNKVGMDTVREALELYREQMKPNRRKLVDYAQICRVERVMRPYLDAYL